MGRNVRTSRLREEIRQGPPFRSLSQEGAIAILRTADVVRRYFSDVVEPSGLTLQQYNVLRILEGAGGAPLPTLEVAHRMIERTPGITRMLDRLERNGLISRKRGPGDRRQVLCRLSPKGARLLRGLRRRVDQADDRCLGMLTPAQQKSLIEILDKVRARWS